MSDAGFDAHYERTLRPILVAQQQRGRRLLRAFWLLVLVGWSLVMWIIFGERLSPWWAVPITLVVVVTGLTVVEQVNRMRDIFTREVMGTLYSMVFPDARHDPRGEVDQDALSRAGFFPSLFGRQRREFSDRLDCTQGGLPVSLCAAAVWAVRSKETNQPDEPIFIGTLFVVPTRRQIDSPVVLLRGDTPVQPMPTGLDLAQQQQVRLGHPVLDASVRVLSASPTAARQALPPPVVDALAAFVARHEGAFRVVLDTHGAVGGVDGSLLAHQVHPKAPLPDAAHVRAEARRVQVALELAAALTAGRQSTS